MKVTSTVTELVSKRAAILQEIVSLTKQIEDNGRNLSEMMLSANPADDAAVEGIAKMKTRLDLQKRNLQQLTGHAAPQAEHEITVAVMQAESERAKQTGELRARILAHARETFTPFFHDEASLSGAVLATTLGQRALALSRTIRADEAETVEAFARSHTDMVEAVSAVERDFQALIATTKRAS